MTISPKLKIEMKRINSLARLNKFLKDVEDGKINKKHPIKNKLIPCTAHPPIFVIRYILSDNISPRRPEIVCKAASKRKKAFILLGN